MSEVIGKAIPIVSALQAGEWWDLSNEDRTNLATWLTMVTMNWEFADRETVAVSERERHEFGVTRSPSQHWHIAIGSAGLLGSRDAVHHRMMFIVTDEPWEGHLDLQVTSLVLGQLIAVAYYCELPPLFDVPTMFRSLGLHPLWPLSGEAIGKPFVTHREDAVGGIIDAISARLSQASHEWNNAAGIGEANSDYEIIGRDGQAFQ